MNITLIFADNLRTIRKKNGYTQQELAHRIGYSEKAISKWECGKSIPPVPELLKIANALNTTIGELLDSKQTAQYFLGIDGGGTKTAFLLENAEGKKIASCVLEASNPNDIGMENCIAVLEKGALHVCAGIDRRSIAVFAGIAGGGLSGNNHMHIEKALGRLGFAFVANGSDVENALEIALHGKDGVAVIAGTGVIAFAQDKGKRHRIGGWGYLIDSGGSGYDIAKDALTACFHAKDGYAPKTVLTDLFETKFEKKLSDAIPEIYQGGKRLIASLTPLVFEAADKQDTVATQILHHNAECLARMIRCAAAHVTDKSAPVVICGGLANRADIFESMIKKLLPDNTPLIFSAEPMVKGAVTCARRMYDEQHGKTK